MTEPDRDRPRVLYWSTAPEVVHAMVRAAAGECFDALTPVKDDPAERRARITEADAVVVASHRPGVDMIETARRFAFVHHQGVGYQDAIDLAVLHRTRHQPVRHDCPGSRAPAVADASGDAAPLLCQCRTRAGPLARQHAALRVPRARRPGGGSVGMGRIGQAATAWFRAFGMRGIHADPDVRLPDAREREFGPEKVDRSTLLTDADVENEIALRDTGRAA